MIDNLKRGKKAIAIVGLGYVGLPLAVEFGKVLGKVIGFDVKKQRIEELSKGIDITGETAGKDLKKARIDFTADPKKA